jgi:hypothetical protein
MGLLEGNKPASDNDWETIKKGGEAAIKRWIDGQMYGRSVAIVLVGRDTAGRKWINYEIEKAWNEGKGLLGIYCHNLKDVNQLQTTTGSNPFKGFTMNRDKADLSSIVKCYDPPHTDSKLVYNHIKECLATWIETAIRIREQY